MMSTAYAEYFFSLPAEAMLGVEAKMVGNEGEIWTEEEEIEENRVIRSSSEGENAHPVIPIPSKPSVITTKPVPPPTHNSTKSPELYPVLGSSPHLTKPRTYSDTPSIDIRDLQQNSPFTIKVESRKKRGKKKEEVKKEVWGQNTQVKVSLERVQKEQKDGGQFFNPWGLQPTESSPQQDFRDIQEAEQAEEDLELALQVIADLEQSARIK